jgi:signal transduction histidine kinase
MARLRLPPGASSPGELLVHAERACRRAADLCRQLLAYAERGPLVSKPVDLAALVREVVAQGDFGAGRHVRIDLDLTQAAPVFPGDSALLRQLLNNVLANAVEAIGSRPGRVTVAVRSVALEAAAVAALTAGEHLVPGPHVCL